MIRCRGLSAHIGDFALRDVTFEVESGRALVVLGPSGAGKTLLLETLLGLRAPSAGTVELDGSDVTRLPPEQRGVSYMPQDVALFPHLSVRENILFGRRVRGTMAGAEDDVAQIAARLRIEHLVAREHVRSLSGGEKQRVGLARAFVVRPRVLFLDESFSALDAHVRAELQSQCREVQRSLGITMVCVTHHFEECFALGDDALVLMNGEVRQRAAPVTLFARPGSLEVARFLRKRNLLRVERTIREASTTRLVVGGVTLEAPGDWVDAEWVHIEPDAIALHEPAKDDALSGEVVSVTSDGARTLVAVRVGEALVLEHMWARRDAPIPAVGARVALQFRPQSIVPVATP